MLLPPIGSLIAGKYRLESLLGEGGMGAVFRARHEVMDKSVAVKWLKPTSGDEAAARHRFMQEARAAARIRHPNVVDVYDVGEQDRCLFMVMELLEGQTFADYLEQKGMAVAEALRHLLAAMRGVAAAHAAGITHRDIKPENIFIAADPLHVQGVAKILDFGISKLHDEPQPSMTLAGTTMGTPHYMSYEQIRCMSDVDHRTDIYAFGVLLYQALTGALPYDGDTLPGIIMQAATGRATRPIALCPDLPPELDELVMKAIALRREDRFQSMDAMINALTRIQLARHSWSSSTERPSWAPGSLPVAAPVLRARAAQAKSVSDTVGSFITTAELAAPIRSFFSARTRGRAPTFGAPAKAWSVPTLGGKRSSFAHGLSPVARPTARFDEGGFAPVAQRKFAPINPWLALVGAALGVVMGGGLYTHLMTPAPSRAGKASASAPTQPEAAFAGTKANVSGGSLLVDSVPGPLLPARPLPSGKEPPPSLATETVSVEPREPQPLAPVAPASGVKLTKPAAPAQAVVPAASPIETQPASHRFVPPLARPGARDDRREFEAPAEPPAPSPVAHPHRSGPLKLEDL